VKVGDFVDAQDSTGKWYEAIVREVSDDTVKVHYFGWASKWDFTLRRFCCRPATGKVGPVRTVRFTHPCCERQLTIQFGIDEERLASGAIVDSFI
jgi:hypothetical protein